MRQYESAWIQLKKTGTLRIAANRALHRRIIKAIIKEKDIDLGFKLECADRFIKAQIRYVRSTSVITFNLKKFNTIMLSKSFDISNL